MKGGHYRPSEDQQSIKDIFPQLQFGGSTANEGDSVSSYGAVRIALPHTYVRIALLRFEGTGYSITSTVYSVYSRRNSIACKTTSYGSGIGGRWLLMIPLRE